jgi:hypothetical protein
MESYDFSQIKETVLKWYQNDINRLLYNNDCVELVNNEKDKLIADMTFKNCMAQIAVSNPTFAPYKYVSFEAMTLDSKKAIESGQPELVYFFYDLPDITETEVINELNFGVKFCSSYIPDEILEKYINKQGLIDINLKNLNRSIHPDDWQKVSTESLNGEFTCVDTQFQYLVVENNQTSLRVLPIVFQTMGNLE